MYFFTSLDLSHYLCIKVLRYNCKKMNNLINKDIFPIRRKIAIFKWCHSKIYPFFVDFPKEIFR